MASGYFYRVYSLGEGGLFFSLFCAAKEKNSFEAAIPPRVGGFFRLMDKRRG